MTVKELKKLIENLPDETKIYIDYEYESGELGWSYIDHAERMVVRNEYNSFFNEFHLYSYEEE